MEENKQKPRGRTSIAHRMVKESVILDKNGNEEKKETLAEALKKKITDR